MRATPVASLVMETSAAERTAPAGSDILPRIVPPAVCAKLLVVKRIVQSAQTKEVRITFFTTKCLPFWRDKDAVAAFALCNRLRCQICKMVPPKTVDVKE